MSADEKYIIRDDDREFFTLHYTAIAERMAKKILWRGPWSIEVDGCVFKFTPKGYAKKGSEAWEESKKEIEEFEARIEGSKA